MIRLPHEHGGSFPKRSSLRCDDGGRGLLRLNYSAFFSKNLVRRTLTGQGKTVYKAREHRKSVKFTVPWSPQKENTAVAIFRYIACILWRHSLHHLHSHWSPQLWSQNTPLRSTDFYLHFYRWGYRNTNKIINTGWGSLIQNSEIQMVSNPKYLSTGIVPGVENLHLASGWSSVKLQVWQKCDSVFFVLCVWGIYEAKWILCFVLGPSY